MSGLVETTREGSVHPTYIDKQLLEVVYFNGKLVKEYTLDEVRENTSKHYWR